MAGMAEFDIIIASPYLTLCSFYFVSSYALELASVHHLATFMKLLNTIAPAKNDEL